MNAEKPESRTVAEGGCTNPALKTQDTEITISQTDRLKQHRLASLDVSRGLTIMLMILVNYQVEPYIQLEHPEWFGFSLADSVFPNFVFIMGLAIPLAMSSGRKPAGWRLWLQVLKRFVLIFLIGVWVNTFPFNSPDLSRSWRPLGVLQRLAVCYLVCSVAFILCSGKPRRSWQYWYLRVGFPLSAFVLWLALTYGIYVPFEGCGRGMLTPECSAEGFVDSQILTAGHNYNQKLYDPEGVLSDITACITCWIGMMVGMNLVKRQAQLSETSYCYQKVAQLCLIAMSLLLVTYFLNAGIPISKVLWTPTFVLMAGALSLSTLAMFMYLVDILGLLNSGYNVLRGFFRMFVVVGKNPLFLYVLSENLASILTTIEVSSNAHYAQDGKVSLWGLLFQAVLASWLPTRFASLVWSLIWVFLIYVPIAFVLDWRGWYIRI
ncbi:hypothetical protein K493DRAFT_342719 [Basidiobolus meristosporus CBS 931.73]|uniref:DUF5009 domain-containing protein n=1 Tax=Basidiobolus meristosporus CBS 931.73 TaxID=1314790 RepID=A0A1Y1X0E5_9FUNG|nr:hypothetical protein K493DRAFT_342719 [Basidiobolus meristosporus CBS 931.73]|eukprot:ORX79250.1 hypothetical protein K493DRAFT_342719 [Basidiobolus meristosporus CBS 931.73]